MLIFDYLSESSIYREILNLKKESEPIKVFYNEENPNTFLTLGILFAMNKKIQIINQEELYHTTSPLKEVIISWQLLKEVPYTYSNISVKNIVFISSRENKEIDRYPENKNISFINYQDKITYEEALKRKQIITDSADMYIITPYKELISYFYLGICYYNLYLINAKELFVKESYSNNYTNVSFYTETSNNYLIKAKKKTI